MSFPFLIVFVLSSKEEINSERFFYLRCWLMLPDEIDGRYVFATSNPCNGNMKYLIFFINVYGKKQKVM